MRIVVGVIVTVAAGLVARADAPKLEKVVLHAVSHPAWHCGGAAIGPNEHSPPPSPITGTLYVRPGKVNTAVKPIEAKFDKDGVASLSLAAGTYCLVTPDKREFPDPKAAPKPANPNEDADCLAARLKQCDTVFVVPAAKRVEIELYGSCFGPCYRGPLPP